MGKLGRILEKLGVKLGIKKKRPWYKKVLSFGFLKDLDKKQKLLLFAMLIIILIVLYFLLFTSGAAKADWWSIDWHYRKAITITNNGSAQTNFQVKVTVDTSDGSKFQTGSNCGADIRFTNQSGDELDYWIESGCGTATTDIWVKIDSIPVGTSKIYMYYGNPSAASTSEPIGVPEGLDVGDGSDGALTVSSNTQVNDYTYLTKDIIPGSNVITVNDSTNFAVGDEILIIQMQDGGSSCNAGDYAFRRITNVSVNDLTLNGGLLNKYCYNDPEIATPNTATSSNKQRAPKNVHHTASVTQVVRVPQYTNVTVNSGYSIIAPYWNGVTGGIVVFRANGTLNIQGDIDVYGKGFRGGSVYSEHNTFSGDDDDGGQGEGTNGWGWQMGTTTCDGETYKANGIGGGGSICINNDGGDPGAGGGYGTAGGDANVNTGCSLPLGGGTIGSADLSQGIFFGGGGGGGSDSDDTSCEWSPFANDPNGDPASRPNLCQRGGHGGGIVLINANTISNSVITANGHSTDPVFDGGPGGGAGGTIYLKADSVGIGTVTANGGPQVCDNKSNGADCGGAGGDGRIRLDYISSLSGTTSPSAYTKQLPTVGSTGTEEKGPGPVGYWSFNSGYGTTAQDRTSNNNDGTITGATWQTEDMCMSGKCLYFDGSEVSLGDSSSFDLNHSFTISGWIKHTSDTSTNYDGIVWRNGGTSGGYRLGLSGGPLRTTVYNNSSTCDLTSGPDLRDNEWHFVVSKLDTDSQKLALYLDGEKLNSVGCSLVPGLVSVPTTIGYKSGTSVEDFQGFIDEPKIYPYARTAAQIKADYNAGRSGGSASALSSGGGSIPTTKSSTNLSDGLVGYWKMDTGVGTTTADSSGNGNNGTAIDGDPTDATCLDGDTPPAITSGKYGNARNYDGCDDYVNVLDMGQSSFDQYTVSAWIKLNELGALYGIYNGGGSGHDRIIVDNDFIRIQMKTSDGYKNWYSSTNLETNKWYHVVVVNNPGNYKLYINGEEDTTDSDSNSLIPESGDIDIGRVFWNGSWRFFNGKIDDVRVYNRALSGKEVRDLYNFAPGPVAHWKMDENSGTDAYDSSGNGNDGSLVGSPQWALGNYGSSLDFDESGNSGNGEYVDINPIEGLNNHQEITAMAWIKPNVATDGRAPIVRADRFYFQHYNDNKLATYWYGWGDPGYYYSSTNSVPVGEWSHVAVTWNQGSGVTFYINGVKDNQIPNSGTGDALDWVKIGQESSGRRFNGKIDDVRIYNYARSQKQIIEDMKAGHPAQTGPIGYWKFNEGYGSTTADSGIGGNDGSITGATWTNAGKFGRALSFDGVNDYVGTNGPSSSFSDTNYTFTAWVKRDSIGTRDTIFYGQPHLGIESNDKIQWNNRTSVNNEYNSIDTISDTNWHHIGVVIDNNITFYLDGKQSGSFVKNEIANDTNSWNIGYVSSGNAWNMDGTIDDVKIYNYALTEDEIKNEYNRGKSAVMGYSGGNGAGGIGQSNLGNYCLPGSSETCGPPVGEWNFEECTGTSAYDTSGNGNTGTLTNMEESDWKPGKIGRGLEFNNTNDTDSDDYVNIPETNIPSGASGEKLTVEFWMKPSTIPNGDIFYMDSEWLIDLENNGEIWIRTWGNNNGGTVNTVSANQWYHVAVTWDVGTGHTVYVNGQEWGSVSAANTDTSLDTGNPLVISGNYGGRFEGLLDGVKIYDYIRTPAQIAWDYNKGKPVGWWKMDECQGDTVIDRSGNGNIGTINIGTLSVSSLGTCPDGTGAWGNGKNGKINSSLSFDGTDDYVSGSTASLNNTDDLSIFAWVKKSIGNRGTVWRSYGTGMDFWNGTSLFRGYIDGASCGWDHNVSYPDDGEWHHVGFSYNHSLLDVYVDGNLKNSFSASCDLNLGSTFNIGKNSYGGSEAFFNGQIDGARIYNYALTKEQVESVYNNGAAKFGTGD